MSELLTLGLMQWVAMLVVIIVTIFLAFLFRRIYKRGILESNLLADKDPTKYAFVGHLITAVIYCIGIGLAIIQVEELKSFAHSLLAGAGILAVAVGFASQHSLSNVISGLFIVIFRPYKINDRILINDTQSGVVEDITLRHTVIRDFQNRRIVIPNSIISDETIINADMTDERILKWIEFSISYDSDIDLAKSIMYDYLYAHPFRIDGRSDEQIEEGIPEVVIRVISLGDSGVVLRAWVWAANSANAFQMTCDAYEEIKKRFDKSNIEIPFPHRTVVFKNQPQL